MAGGISRMANQELLATIRDRYRGSSEKDTGRILDEFISVLDTTANPGSGCLLKPTTVQLHRISGY